MMRTGVLLAVAAILAQGPRLVLVFLAADRHQLSEEWTTALLVITGVGTALVLTAGNVYLAHQAALHRKKYITVLWLIVLGCSGVLAAPLVVAGLKGVRLEAVLASSGLQWTWSLLAVLAHELVAGGCMLADVASQQIHAKYEQLEFDLSAARADLENRSGQLAAQQDRARRAEQAAADLAAGRRRTLARRVPTGESRSIDLNAVRECPNGCGFEGQEMAVRGHMRACRLKAA